MAFTFPLFRWAWLGGALTSAVMPTRRAALGLIAAAATHRSAPASAAALVAAARRQIGVTLAYDRGYHRLAYPGGNVPRRTGVCCGVVIRAARDAWGVDLPGAMLTWRTFLNSGPHVAIVSQGGAWPKVIENYGWGVREDWLAQEWLNTATAHFRWRPLV